MRRLMIAAAILVAAPFGCSDEMPDAASESTPRSAGEDASSESPLVLTSPDQILAHVGQVVTLRGIVSNTKIPTILGVDVSCDLDVRGQLAEATGLLEQWVVTPESLEGAEFAHRGPGVFARLKALGSEYDAAARPVEAIDKRER